MSVPIALRFLLPVGIKGLFLSIWSWACSPATAGICIPGAAFLFRCDSAVEEKTFHAQTTHLALRFSITGVAVSHSASARSSPPNNTSTLWLLTAAVSPAARGRPSSAGFTGKKEQHRRLDRRDHRLGAGRHRDHHRDVLAQHCSDDWPNDVELEHPSAAEILVQLSGFRIYRFLHGREFVCDCFTHDLRRNFNLDQMLHRGKYAVEAKASKPLSLRQKLSLKNIMRFDENFTFGDKLVAGEFSGGR